MKKAIIVFLIMLVFLAMFNILFFIILGFNNSSGIWISYAAIHIAFLFIPTSSLFTRTMKKSIKPVIMSFYLWNSIYFIIELIVGITFIVLNPISYIIPLIVQVILLGLFLILNFSLLLVAVKTDESLRNH